MSARMCIMHTQTDKARQTDRQTDKWLVTNSMCIIRSKECCWCDLGNAFICNGLLVLLSTFFVHVYVCVVFRVVLVKAAPRPGHAVPVCVTKI